MCMTVCHSIKNAGSFVATDTRAYGADGKRADTGGKLVSTGSGWATGVGAHGALALALRSLRDAGPVRPGSPVERQASVIRAALSGAGYRVDYQVPEVVDENFLCVSLVESAAPDSVTVTNGGVCETYEGEYMVSLPRLFSQDETASRLSMMGRQIKSVGSTLAARIRMAAVHFNLVSRLADSVSDVMEVGYVLPTPDGPVLGFLRGKAHDIANTDDREILSRFAADHGGAVMANILPEFNEDGSFAAKSSTNDGTELHPDVVDDRGFFVNDHYNLAHHTLDDASDGASRFAAAEAGANVTETRTAAAIAGQGALATKTTVATADIDNLAVGPAQSRDRNRCRLYGSGNWSTSNSTPLILPFDSESWDFGGLHNTAGGSNTKIVIPAGGNARSWRLTAHVEWAANGTGYRQLSIIKNGFLFAPSSVVAAVVGGGVTTQELSVDDDAPAVGDYYEVQILQTSGGALNVTGSGPNGSNFTSRHEW